MSEQPLEHWPTERMVLEGHAEVAVREDLEDLSDEELAKVAEICVVNEFAPDECIPCYAHTVYLDRQKDRLEDMAPDLPEDDDFGSVETSKLDALVEETPVFEQPTKRPPVERLQLQVAMLQTTLEEIIDGPPIPPKDVSMEELALLVVGADRWVKMTEAQGVDLSPPQQAVLDSTKNLVARLRS